MSSPVVLPLRYMIWIWFFLKILQLISLSDFKYALIPNLPIHDEGFSGVCIDCAVLLLYVLM